MICRSMVANMSYEMDLAEFFNAADLQVILFDYRGFGQSTGAPTEEGVNTDARSIWDFVTSELGVERERMIIYGRASGGAVAATLAADVNPAGLIIEAGYPAWHLQASQQGMALSSRLFSGSFDAMTGLEKSTCPLLVIQSDEDDTVAPALGRMLFDAARAPKTFFPARGRHGDAIFASREEYREALGGFMDDCLLQVLADGAGKL